MSRWQRFFHRSRLERALLVKAAALLLLIRIALGVMPLRTLKNILAWRLRSPSPDRKAPSLRQIRWAVECAARRITGSTCLVQGLAALRLGRSAGYDVNLIIGTAKDIDGGLDAHAWVEYEGETILGTVREKSFTPLLIWTDGGWRPAGLERP
jgi:hypothetical protein